MAAGGGAAGPLGVAAALAALVALGCASFPENPRLAAVDPATGYRLEHLELGPHNSEETFVVVTLSGGGTRAASLAYGALAALAATALPGGGTLLDEVDVVSSVSGGSFAAAYLGLFGAERFLADFPEAVLHRRMQSAALKRLLSPWNWPRLFSPRFGRSELAEHYYAGKIFARKSYGELPRRRPFVVLNAADLGLGSTFAFTQEVFDRICSDLDGVPVARAVLSSSAFPGAFTPVALRNWRGAAGGCRYEEPEWVELALGDGTPCVAPEDPGCGNLEENPRSWDRARVARATGDPRRRYLHLVDGGVADNIGLRGPIDALTTTASEWTRLGEISRGKIERIVVVSVDAKPRKRPRQDERARPPKILPVLSGAASRPMANYSTDTVELLRERIREWERNAITFERQRAVCDRLATRDCTGEIDPPACEAVRRERCRTDWNLTDAFRPVKPELYRIHVRFDAIRDPEHRRRLQELPTSLQLPRATVDELVRVAGELLREAHDYRRLVADLGGGPP